MKRIGQKLLEADARSHAFFEKLTGEMGGGGGETPPPKKLTKKALTAAGFECSGVMSRVLCFLFSHTRQNESLLARKSTAAALGGRAAGA